MADIPPEKLFQSLSISSLRVREPGLILDLLLRLPVKTLLQFRCVSKSWRALIDGPFFIKKHLYRSMETETNLKIVYGTAGFSSEPFYVLNLYSASFGFQMWKPVQNPIISDNHDTIILGSCNGVLCLLTTHLSPPLLLTTPIDKEIALLNPSTREFTKIPIPPDFRQGPIRERCVYGFGYDGVNDDYKVVRVVPIRDNNLNSGTGIYSLKSRLWRWVRGFPYYIGPGLRTVFASGCLHWICGENPEPNCNLLIVAFDLASEDYRIVPQPEYSHRPFTIRLGAVSGILCVRCRTIAAGEEIWLMDTYGLRGSWRKLFVSPRVMSVFEFNGPLWYSKLTGVMLIKDHHRIVWYDTETQTVKKFFVSRKRFVADVYVESLAQLNGGSA